MKKPKAVIAAQEALAAKQAEVSAAKETLARLEKEVGPCYVAVVTAQTEADAGLPQCRMVNVRWRGGEEGGAPYVIVRKTPGGLLIVRRVGDPSGFTYKFKWDAANGVYRQAEKESAWARDYRGLRDVPAEYLPFSPRTKSPT